MPVFVARACDQHCGIARAARRRGRDGADMGGAALADMLGADLERRDRALDGGLGQPPVCATPSPSRTMREKESTTRELAVAAPAARSGAGNCWCRDRARRAPARAWRARLCVCDFAWTSQPPFPGSKLGRRTAAGTELLYRTMHFIGSICAELRRPPAAPCSNSLHKSAARPGQNMALPFCRNSRSKK